VSWLTVIAKVSFFARRPDHTATPAVGTQRFRSTLAGGARPSGIGDTESARRQNSDRCSRGNLRLAFIAQIPFSPGLDFAAQSAPDELRKTYLLAPGFLNQAILYLSRQVKRYGYTAAGQSRSGHLLSVLLYHIPCQGRIFLSVGPHYETVGDVRDKESTAITITLPRALDPALPKLADEKHCGNKSAAIREVLYREAGMKTTLRLNEKSDSAALAKAEGRSVKYGSRKRKSRK
jgi:hypothetical protein